MNERPSGLITLDTVLIRGDRSKMHPVDIAILDEAGGKAITIEQMIEMDALEKTLFRSPHEPAARERDPSETDTKLYELTPESIQYLRKTGFALSEKTQAIALRLVNQAQASYIRELRVERGLSWRMVADRVFGMLAPLLLYHEQREWQPYSNQVMGMALCERAALLRGEDFLQEPWN